MPTTVCASCGQPATTKCSQCKRVAYCSRACQKQDWKNHKPSCSKPQGTPAAGALDPFSWVNFSVPESYGSEDQRANHFWALGDDYENETVDMSLVSAPVVQLTLRGYPVPSRVAVHPLKRSVAPFTGCKAGEVPPLRPTAAPQHPDADYTGTKLFSTTRDAQLWELHAYRTRFERVQSDVGPVLVEFGYNPEAMVVPGIAVALMESERYKGATKYYSPDAVPHVTIVVTTSGAAHGAATRSRRRFDFLGSQARHEESPFPACFVYNKGEEVCFVTENQVSLARVAFAYVFALPELRRTFLARGVAIWSLFESASNADKNREVRFGMECAKEFGVKVFSWHSPLVHTPGRLDFSYWTMPDLELDEHIDRISAALKQAKNNDSLSGIGGPKCPHCMGTAADKRLACGHWVCMPCFGRISSHLKDPSSPFSAQEVRCPVCFKNSERAGKAGRLIDEATEVFQRTFIVRDLGPGETGCIHLNATPLTIGKPNGIIRPRKGAWESLGRESGLVWDVTLRKAHIWMGRGEERIRPWILFVTGDSTSLVGGKTGWHVNLTENAQSRGKSPPSHDIVTVLIASAIASGTRPETLEVTTRGSGKGIVKTLTSLCDKSETNKTTVKIRDDKAPYPLLVRIKTQQFAYNVSRTAGDPIARSLLTSCIGSTPELLRNLYSKAAEWTRSKPWKVFSNSEVAQVSFDHKSMGNESGILMFLGASGKSDPGALRFETFPELKRFYLSKNKPELFVGTRFEYSSHHYQSFADLDDIEEHGWPVASPEWYPSWKRENFVSHEPLPLDLDERQWNPGLRELIWWELAMEAVSRHQQECNLHLIPSPWGCGTALVSNECPADGNAYALCSSVLGSVTVRVRVVSATPPSYHDADANRTVIFAKARHPKP